MLPSSSLLILDFIQAANGVVISQNMEVGFYNQFPLHFASESQYFYRYGLWLENGVIDDATETVLLTLITR